MGALLEVRDLHIAYGKTEIVHGVSFDVSQGDFACIIGANGCGKTTTLKSILGLLKPTSGYVGVDGTDTLTLTEKERAKFFAYIPQAHTPPFPFKVSDVVIMGRTPYLNNLNIITPEDRKIAYEAMERLGITDHADESYTELSGGQQQLVLIARAVAQQPRLLIMDEPTASLDFGNQQMVLAQMKSLTECGTAVLMVTHDPDHALVCANHVIAMHDGEVLSDGTTDEVLTSDTLGKVYGIKVGIGDVCVEGVCAKVCVPLPG